MHKAWCIIEKLPYSFLRSSIKFHGHMGWKINNLNLVWVRLLGRSQLSNSSDLPCFHCNPVTLTTGNSFRYCIMSSSVQLFCVLQRHHASILCNGVKFCGFVVWRRVKTRNNYLIFFCSQPGGRLYWGRFLAWGNDWYFLCLNILEKMAQIVDSKVDWSFISIWTWYFQYPINCLFKILLVAIYFMLAGLCSIILSYAGGDNNMSSSMNKRPLLCHRYYVCQYVFCVSEIISASKNVPLFTQTFLFASRVATTQHGRNLQMLEELILAILI